MIIDHHGCRGKTSSSGITLATAGQVVRVKVKLATAGQVVRVSLTKI